MLKLNSTKFVPANRGGVRIVLLALLAFEARVQTALLPLRLFPPRQRQFIFCDAASWHYPNADVAFAAAEIRLGGEEKAQRRRQTRDSDASVLRCAKMPISLIRRRDASMPKSHIASAKSR